MKVYSQCSFGKCTKCLWPIEDDETTAKVIKCPNCACSLIVNESEVILHPELRPDSVHGGTDGS